MIFPLRRLLNILNSKRFSNRTSTSMATSWDDISKNRFVWIDMEMTGLDIVRHHILEIACVVTTPNLNVLHEGINVIIHQNKDVLQNMNEWCIEHHGKSGLTKQSDESTISLPEAEKIIYEYVKKYTVDGGSNYIAGNSVGYDKMFLNKYMPRVDNLLSYRIIDISTVKELVRHWIPESQHGLPKKELTHRALSDIRESIEELKYYHKLFLNIKA